MFLFFRVFNVCNKPFILPPPSSLPQRNRVVATFASQNRRGFLVCLSKVVKAI